MQCSVTGTLGGGGKETGGGDENRFDPSAGKQKGRKEVRLGGGIKLDNPL